MSRTLPIPTGSLTSSQSSTRSTHSSAASVASNSDVKPPWLRRDKYDEVEIMRLGAPSLNPSGTTFGEETKFDNLMLPWTSDGFTLAEDVMTWEPKSLPKSDHCECCYHCMPMVIDDSIEPDSSEPRRDPYEREPFDACSYNLPRGFSFKRLFEARHSDGNTNELLLLYCSKSPLKSGGLIYSGIDVARAMRSGLCSYSMPATDELAHHGRDPGGLRTRGHRWSKLSYKNQLLKRQIMLIKISSGFHVHFQLRMIHGSHEDIMQRLQHHWSIRERTFAESGSCPPWPNVAEFVNMTPEQSGGEVRHVWNQIVVLTFYTCTSPTSSNQVENLADIDLCGYRYNQHIVRSYQNCTHCYLHCQCI